MSSTRGSNKFCLSLDNSTSNTSSNTTYLNRWSEVVPPRTALTFAALWDPEQGMVTFSGAELLESESLSGAPSHFFDDDDDDDCSQLISAGRDTDGGTISVNTATLATFQDTFDVFLHCAPSDATKEPTKGGRDSPRCLQTRASSMFDGLDVYSHDIQLKRTRTRSLQLSCMDLLDVESTFRTPCEFGRFQLKSEVMRESGRSDSESDSSSATRRLHPKSHFSTTTTSTSNYVDITNAPPPSIQNPGPALVPTEPCVSPAGSWPYLPQRRRGVLRKRRPRNSGGYGHGDMTPTGTRSMPSPSATVFSSSVSAIEEGVGVGVGHRGQGRGQFSRLDGVPTTPTPTLATMLTPTLTTTSTTTPPTSPSNKSLRRKLRFAFPAGWRSRQSATSNSSLPPRWSDSESEGWVCIDVTPTIKQRYVVDL